MIPAAVLACAPNVAPVTLEAVIRVESGGNPWAINVNGLRAQPAPAASAAEAARMAESYILRGYSVDLGLMQVNSRNLVALGTTTLDDARDLIAIPEREEHVLRLFVAVAGKEGSSIGYAISFRRKVMAEFEKLVAEGHFNDSLAVS